MSETTLQNTVFTDWSPISGKDMVWKIKMKEAMSQAWMHMVCAYLDNNSQKIKEIDELNKKLEWNRLEPDASIEVIGKNHHIVVNALYTLFFKEPYINKKQSALERDDKFNWLCLITQTARIVGYKKYRDGKQVQVTCQLTRTQPSTSKTFHSFLSIGTTNLHVAEALILSLDEHNYVNMASMRSLQNNTIIKTISKEHLHVYGGKTYETNWNN